MTYTGPSARLAPDRLRALPPHVAVQPKVDGCYATLRTDHLGRICSVTSRAGRPLREGAELLGLPAGPPLSVLTGELEAHTEAGGAAYARTGYRRCHLFDCLAVRGVSVASQPYATRHAWLGEIRDDLLASEPWHEDARGRAHATDGTGRYVRRTSLHLPVVPLLRGHEAARELWRQVEAGALEGLVAVDLRAPAGRGKRKVKATDTADCRVLAVSPGLLTLAAPRSSPAGWRGESFVVQFARAAGLAPGAVVEVAHDGCYASGLPRFPRVVRVRRDLAWAPMGRVA
jgi:hypothetical protein